MDQLPLVEKSRKRKAGAREAAGAVTSADRGDVLALVGGRDVRFPGFNRALDSRRSIGSLANTFVYLTALEHPEQYNIESMIDYKPIKLNMPGSTGWPPKKYARKLQDPPHLYIALAHSQHLDRTNAR